MDKINITNLLRLVFVAAISVATTIDVQACTNFVAGKDATVDGSTMVTYAADSHTLYGYLQHLPAADHPKGAMREVREWDTGKPLGHIHEAAHTYSVVGNQDPSLPDPSEVDSNVAERIVILPPFGEARIYYILAGVVAIILIGGIILIRRKVLNGKDDKTE